MNTTYGCSITMKFLIIRSCFNTSEGSFSMCGRLVVVGLGQFPFLFSRCSRKVWSKKLGPTCNLSGPC